MRRRDFMKLSAGLGAAPGLSPLSSVRAQTKSVFRASGVQPPGYPTVVATENLGKKQAATGGRQPVAPMRQRETGNFPRLPA
jgi:hypothetical protein